MIYKIINAATLRVGGGKSVTINFLKRLFLTSSKVNYIIILPLDQDYIDLCINLNDNYKILFVPKYLHNPILKPFLEFWILKEIKKYNYKIIFNLGNYALPIQNKYQIVLFHFPYAVYPESLIWERMDLIDRYRFRAMTYFFKIRLKYADKIICQTKVMEERLKKNYYFENTVVIPNGISLDAYLNTNETGVGKIDCLKGIDGLKLLLFSHYYPHKNFEVLIPLALKVKENNLNYKFIITISEMQGIGAKKLLEKIKSEKLEDIIINIGSVNMNLVPILYNSVDALFMPTLLESFSGTYIEAMYYKKIILTSNLDFAKDVCKTNALYFDPLNVDSILESISKIMKIESNKFLENAFNSVNQNKNWNEISEMLLNELNER